MNTFASLQVLIYSAAIGAYRLGNLEVAFLSSIKNAVSIFGALGVALLGAWYLIYWHGWAVEGWVWVYITGLFFASHLVQEGSRLIPFDRVFRLMSFTNLKRGVERIKNRDDFYHSLEELQHELKSVFVGELYYSDARIVPLSALPLQPYAALREELTHHRETLVYSELLHKQADQQTVYPYTEGVGRLGEAVLPLYRGEQLIGVLVMGDKPHQGAYTKEEIDLLESLSLHLGLSLSVLLYNEDLRHQVKVKTEELQRANERLKEIDAAKSSFLSVASHELRTPMTIIKGYSDFLLSGKFGQLSDQQRDFLQKIYGSTDSLIKLVNNILDISKIEAGKMEFSYTRFPLEPFLSRIEGDYALACEQRGIGFTLVRSEGLPLTVYTDAEKIELVLRNLIGNAMKFTPAGGQITLEVYAEQEQLHWVVEDTGIGIPPEEVPRLFEKFRQVRNYLQKEHKGSGLGLSIVQKILRSMHGDITATSIEGKGSTFTCHIPYNEDVVKKR